MGKKIKKEEGDMSSFGERFELEEKENSKLLRDRGVSTAADHLEQVNLDSENVEQK